MNVTAIVEACLMKGGMTHQQIADHVRERLPGSRTTAKSVKSIARDLRGRRGATMDAGTHGGGERPVEAAWPKSDYGAGVAEAAWTWRGPGATPNPPFERRSPRLPGLHPGAERMLEVIAEEEGILWEDAVVAVLNDAAVERRKSMWAELDAMANGVVGESSVDVIRRLRDGEDDAD